jgi:thioredoxin 1
MAGKNVLDITDDNFDQEVLKSKEPFLLDFSAVWCGPCKMLTPIVEKVADENTGKVRVGKLDIDDSPGVAQKFGIPSAKGARGGSFARAGMSPTASRSSSRCCARMP